MSMEINSSPVGSTPLLKELEGVDVVAAQKFQNGLISKDEDFEAFYLKSGIKGIFSEIKESFKDLSLEAVFFENSTLPSTLKTNQLTAFIGCWAKNYGNTTFRENVWGSYQPLIKSLQADNAVIFMHPQFCIQVNENIKGKLPQIFYSISEIKKKSSKELNESPKEILTPEDSLHLAAYHAEKGTAKINLDGPSNLFGDHRVFDRNYWPKFKSSIDDNVFALNVSFPMHYEAIRQEEQVKVQSRCADPKLLHLANHYAYDFKFSKNCFDDSKHESLFISVPLTGAKITTDDGGTYYFGQGALFFYLVFKGDMFNYHKDLNGLVHKFGTSVADLVKNYNAGYVFEAGLQQARKARESAGKAAKAAIMARNMSHNIGSHVISYLKQNLSDVEEIIKRGVLQELIDEEGKLKSISHKSSIREDIEIKELPFLLGLGRFLTYLQERQDFIATIATDHIPSLSSVNFKEFVFDELTYDNKIKRHNNDNNTNYKRVDNILLKYIAKSEKFSRKNDTEQKLDNEITLFFNGHSENDRFDNEESLKQISVELPGGIIGRQAIFSIFENIIRNAAKHGGAKLGKENLQLFFWLIDGNSTPGTKHYQVFVNILKSIAKESFGTLTEDEFQNYVQKLRSKYYMFTITDNIILEDDEIISNINNKLSSKLLSYNNEFDEDAKGLKEIRISAAWLRRQSVLDDDSYNNNNLDGLSTEPKPVYTLLSNDEVNDMDGQVNTLKYVFFLLRPQKAAYIFYNEPLNYKSIKEQLKKSGWNIFSLNELLDTNGRFNYSHNYKILLLEDSVKEYFDKYKIKVNRVVQFSYHDLNDLLLKSLQNDLVSEDLYIKHYKTCIKTFYKNDGPFPDVYLKDSESKWLTYNSENIEIKPANLITKFSSQRPSIAIIRHLLSEKETLKEIRTAHMEGKIIHAEQATGSNSTYRLVRSLLGAKSGDSYSKIELLKLIEAAQCKILIIDERIHDQLTGGLPATVDFLERLAEIETTNETYSEKINILKNLLQEYKIIINDIIQIEDINQRIDSLYYKNKAGKGEFNWQLANALLSKLKDRESLLNESPDVILNDLRNITIANFDRKNYLIDLKLKRLGQYLGNNKFSSLDDQFSLNSYHFICVHQGLIDKLKNAYPTNIVDMKQFTKEFLEITLKSDAMKVVHSGRSRPQDLPENLPFIPFSVLNAALTDSKITLCDQLFSLICK